MHETGLGKSLERQENEKNKGLVHSEGAKREEASSESCSMEVQGLDSCSPVSSGRKPAPHFKINKTLPEEHHLTMEKQPKPQRRVWSDELGCCACCFPWACRLRVLLILLLLHFLLHLPAPRSLAAGGARRPVASAVQRGAPDKRGLGFSGSPRGPQSGSSGGGGSDQSQLNQTLQHPSIPVAPARREGYRTGEGCCCTRTPSKAKIREVGRYFSIAWPGNEQSRLTLTDTQP